MKNTKNDAVWIDFPPIEADFRVFRPDLEILVEWLSLRYGTFAERVVHPRLDS